MGKRKDLFCTALFCAALVLAAASASAAGTEPKIVASDYRVGYMPEGFDTNDHVQIVAEGMFPNTCFKPAAADMEIDRRAKQILLKPTAYHYNGVCAEVLVPFHQVLEVGLLTEGRYEVRVEGNTQSLGQVTVRDAISANADDYLYAPISQAYYHESGGRHLVVMSGEFTNTCVRISDIKVDVQPRVIVVQPITEIVGRSQCRPARIPFEKQIELPALRQGRYLLHVRSLNAKSINNLIDVR